MRHFFLLLFFDTQFVWCSGKDTHHDLRSKVQTRYVDNRDALVKDPKSLLPTVLPR